MKPTNPCCSNLAARLLVFVIVWQAAIVPTAYTGIRRPLAERRASKGALTNASNHAPASSMHKRNPQFNPQVEAVEAAVVRHAPTINGGARVEGAVRQLTGEDVSLAGGAVITSALLVPGTPQLRLNGNPNFGGTVEGTGSPQPSGYRVTLNGNVMLGRLVTRVDPILLATVAPPPQAAGTRNVVITQPGQDSGNFATIRDLTLNGNVGSVSVPPGTYRNFIANGTGSFVFGVQGATEPAVYNLNSLILNGGSSLLIAGPVVLTLASSLTLNGMAGASTDPRLLTLRVASGGVTLNGGSSLYAAVQSPSGTAIINGNSLLQGSVVCDRLTVNGGGMLKGTEGILQSISPVTATQGQTLRVTLRGRNTHWVAGLTRASFGGEVSVGGSAPGEPGPVQVADPFTAVADLFVSTTAALAARTVRVLTPVFSFDEGETELLIDAFKVAATSPPGATSSQVSTLTGIAGSPGFNDGTASQARFSDLAGIAVGPDDTVYVADAGNNRIRLVRPASATSSATVSTLAGDGTAGFADGQGASARFNNPQGVAVAPSGVVYVADTGNHRIRRIATGGTVTTLAGDGTAGFQNGLGNQARFNSPSRIAIDNAGNLYVADTGNSAVRFISASGEVSTVAGDGTAGSTDAPTARFNGLAGIVVDGATAYVYIADTGNHRVRRLDPRGPVITLAGANRGFADGSAAQARFADPSGIAVDGIGHLVIADSTNSLMREVDLDLDVLSFEADTESIDSCERVHRSVKTMVDHADNRYLIIQNAADLFEAVFSLLGNASALEISAKLAKQFIIPKFRHPKPVSVSLCSSVSQREYSLIWIENDVNAFITAHSPRKRDHSLLAVDQPIHCGCTTRSGIPSARTRHLTALPNKQGRYRESLIQRIDQTRCLVRFPNILSLELWNHRSTKTIVFNQLTNLNSLVLQTGFNHLILMMSECRLKSFRNLLLQSTVRFPDSTASYIQPCNADMCLPR